MVFHEIIPFNNPIGQQDKHMNGILDIDYEVELRLHLHEGAVNCQQILQQKQKSQKLKMIQQLQMLKVNPINVKVIFIND